MGLGCVKLSDQIRKAVWYPLPHDIVVHGAELVADSRLNLGVEAALLARLFYILHELFHAFPAS
jgi:hypothetical protein